MNTEAMQWRAIRAANTHPDAADPTMWHDAYLNAMALEVLQGITR